ncbi:DUF2190 family protein [Pseudoxanthomonas indica]|uniref:Predicted phage recombinase, RecA/RadA family n=1 Tax=Pseudoxanthomonas indica TaxID=428993 RepID=A0A1T5K127_9GAMM|nr:DUF2190 family protein [Pseudoxanthomonas indica]GGD45765.1 hypothetical protein GCM10007235_17150 [Pseudoxanthomonas indica]SKC57215.1 Predicted phage recombinase, RecA/RadA family [Pseudoxanthomonas indica]
MAKNYVSKGDVIPWTNSTGNAVVSGQVVALGHCIGVVLAAIAAGATGSVAVEGVFTVPKVSAAVFVQGEKLVFDVSANSGAGAFDDSAATPATGDITGGAVAWAAGSDGQTTATVKLTPGNAAKA